MYSPKFAAITPAAASYSKQGIVAVRESKRFPAPLLFRYVVVLSEAEKFA
jgi:hypothetical protein